MNLFLQLLLNGLINGCAYALVAVGFALIYNTTRIFHFAHGGIYVLSGYLFFSFYTQSGLPLWFALLITLLLAAIAGILIDWLVYRPLDQRGASTIMYMISSFGVYVIIISGICMLYGNHPRVVHAPLPTFSFGGITLNAIQITTAVIFIAVFVALVFTLKYSSLGLKLRAMRDNQTLLALYGINPNNTRLCIFGVGSALCALAAILVSVDTGIDPHVGMKMVMTAAVAVIVGGIGVFAGVAAGALILGGLQGIAVWLTSTQWQDLVTFAVLIFCLLFRPQGILGYRGRLEEDET